MDERPKFLFLDPDYIICTNIDFDHPDVYKDFAAVKIAFKTFFQKLQGDHDKRLIYCADDNPSVEVVQTIDDVRKISFGLSTHADVCAKNIHVIENGTSFDLYYLEKKLGTCFIRQFGTHSVLNTLAVLAFCIDKDLPLDGVLKACGSFVGAQRRFQLLYENNDISLYDDYAHHPRAIGAVIDGFRKAFPHRRLVLIYQPHTYTRTKALLHETAKALSKADRSYVIDIYASAREKELEGTVSSQDIETDARSAGIKNVSYVHKDNIISQIKQMMEPGDVIVTLGAGDDVYFMHDSLQALINNL